MEGCALHGSNAVLRTDLMQIKIMRDAEPYGRIVLVQQSIGSGFTELSYRGLTQENIVVCCRIGFLRDPVRRMHIEGDFHRGIRRHGKHVPIGIPCHIHRHGGHVLQAACIILFPDPYAFLAQVLMVRNAQLRRCGIIHRGIDAQPSDFGQAYRFQASLPAGILSADWCIVFQRIVYDQPFCS